MPADLAAALAGDAAAARCFASLPPSQQRAYTDWLDSAQRAETRARRLAQALDKLGQGLRWAAKPAASGAPAPAPPPDAPPPG